MSDDVIWFGNQSYPDLLTHGRPFRNIKRQTGARSFITAGVNANLNRLVRDSSPSQATVVQVNNQNNELKVTRQL